jgi:predicted alpha-1,6-mannanase (GH76 family)
VGGGFHSDLLTRVAALSAYHHSGPGRVSYAPVYGGSGDVYYDDNLWIAMALIEATGVTHNRSSLDTARQLFTLVTDGWDSNQADPCPGGVFWKRTGVNHDRNTVTTANSALLALTLYKSSPRPGYLLWAQRAYSWAKTCLGTGNGLVADHVDLAGRIDPHTWSYNQGAMIATAVRLFQLTGQRQYLSDAEQDADATLAKLGNPLASGEPAVFLAIFYRDLLGLSAVDPKRNDRAAVATFADEAWAKARDPKTGIFHFGHNVGTLLDQAAMVQIYALLSS